MATFVLLRHAYWRAIAAVLSLAATAASADNTPLDLLVGRWDAHVETLQPQPSEITYSETYRWVLGGKFLEGRIERKSDGTEDLTYGTYDPQTKGYPYWVFSSSGSFVYLAPATWDGRARTLEWTNPANSDLTYRTVVEFPDDRTRRWTVLVKDWKGSVILQQRGSAVRHTD